MRLIPIICFTACLLLPVGCVDRTPKRTSTKTATEVEKKSTTKKEPAQEQIIIPPRPTGFPDYQGKTAEYWISQFQDKDVRLQPEAIVAIRHIGSHALPALTKMLDAEKENDQLDAVYLLGVVGFPAAECVPKLVKLADRSKQVDDKTVYPYREAVLDTLAQIGPDAGEVVPALSAWIDDPSLTATEQIKSAVALWLIDEAQEPKARNGLLKHASSGRFDAFAALGRFGPKAVNAVPKLRELLTSKDDDIRLNAAGAVWVIAHDKADVLPVLVEVYRNPKIKIPMIDRITWLLEEMGPAAKPMTTYLVADIKSHKQYYWRLAPTLFKIDPWEAKKVGIMAPFAARGKQLSVMYENRPLQDWIRELQYSNLVVFRNAVTALRKLGKDAGASVPYLVHAYNQAPAESGIPKVAMETLQDLAPEEAKKLDANFLKHNEQKSVK